MYKFSQLNIILCREELSNGIHENKHKYDTGKPDKCLYGLILPSGNDASVAITEVIGRIIQRDKKKPSAKTPDETFISHMNILTK